jgi:hypothetical protein
MSNPTHLWQTSLRFFDAHPWFVPSVGAIIIIATFIRNIVAWTFSVILNAWNRHQEYSLLDYLANQVHKGPRIPDGYGHVAPLHEDRTPIEIANAKHKASFKVRAILERLKAKNLVDHHAHLDRWRISADGLHEYARRHKAK